MAALISRLSSETTASFPPRSQKYLELNTVDSEKRALVTDFDPERYFNTPTAVAIDNDGRIIIVDNIRLRLQVYRKEMA